MKKLLLSGAFLLFVGSLLTELNAQSTKSRAFGGMYIPGKGSATIFSKHSFHDGGSGIYPGVITTEREKNKSYINFGKGSSWVGASDMQFVDGYAKVLHNEPFTFPVGANGKFRPVSISGASRTSVAYFDYDPAIINGSTAEKSADIAQLSPVEYWDINGVKDTKITLTWDQISGIESMTESDINRLTIVGWRNNQWEVIPSSVDRFTLDVSSSNVKMGLEVADFSKGSITTNDLVRPDDYDYYTLAALNPQTMQRIQPEFDVFPNPVSTRVEANVNYQFASETGGYIRIYSANNVLVLEQKVSNQRGIITLPNTVKEPGIYVIGVEDHTGATKYDKLIILEK